MPQRYANTILAHHMLWTLYGHWPPNDIRGSGSDIVHDEDLAALGPVHRGRKPAHLQPSRAELRAFHARVQEVLFHPVFWLDSAKRQAWADAIREVVHREKYTAYACAILHNHAHMAVRRHRDDDRTIWRAFADAAIARLREFDDVRAINGIPHPVLAARPYVVFLRTPDEVDDRIKYVEDNPEKEGLPRQVHDYADFVTRYAPIRTR